MVLAYLVLVLVNPDPPRPGMEALWSIIEGAVGSGAGRRWPKYAALRAWPP